MHKLGVGDPDGPTNPLRALFGVEVAVFALAAAAFLRAGMKVPGLWRYATGSFSPLADAVVTLGGRSKVEKIGRN